MSTAGEDEPVAFAKLWGQLDSQPFHSYVTSLPSTLGRGSSSTEGASKPKGFITLGRSKALSREHAAIDWVPGKKSYEITCLSKNGMVVAGKYYAKGGVERLDSRTPIKLGPASMYFLLPERNTGASVVPPPPPVAIPETIPSMADRLGATLHSTAAPGAHRPQAPALITPAQSPVQPKTVPVVIPAQVQSAQAVEAPHGYDFMVLGAFRSPALSALAAGNGLSSGDVQNWIMQNYPEWNQEGEKMRTLAVGIDAVLSKRFVPSGGDRWKEGSVSGEPSAKRVKLFAESPVAAVPAPPVALAAEGVASGTSVAGGIANGTESGGASKANGAGGVVAASAEGGWHGEEDGAGIDVGMDD